MGEPVRFYSTNRKVPVVGLAEALLQGQAGDRGLFLPERVPNIEPEEPANWPEASYAQIACEVLRRFTGLVPDHLHEEVPAFRIHPEVPEDDAGDPLERMHARSRQDEFPEVVPFENAFHGGRVGLAPEEAEPRQDAAGLVHPHGLDQVLSELGKGMDIVKHQTPSMEVKPSFGKLYELIQLQVISLHAKILSK